MTDRCRRSRAPAGCGRDPSMTDLAVRTVRIRGMAPGSSPRAAAEALLRAMVPTFDDHGVLIVRRLRLEGFRGDDARARLAEVRTGAARPALAASGVESAAGADAVWFSDEAEALACLTADLIAGSAASRWYWRSRLPTALSWGSSLAQVWLRDARWLPTALRLLESATPGAAVRATATLTTREAALVLAAVLPSAGLAPPLRIAASWLDRRPGRREVVEPEREPPAAPGTAARWARMLPSGTVALPLVQRHLLAVAMVLAVEPAAPVAELRAWARAVNLPAQPIAPSDGRPVSEPQAPLSTRTPHSTPTPAGDGQPGRRIVEGDAHDDAGGGRHFAEPTEPLAPSRPSGAGTAAAVHQPAIPGDEPIERPRNRTQRPLPSENRERPAYGLLDRWPETIWSEHATACYLLNLILRFDEEPSWADLLRLTRRVLRGRPGVRRRARDPLWGVLQDLAGGGRIRPAPAPTWRQTALDFLTEHRLGAAVFCQPGRIAVTRTHVDVILDLEQIDLAVRISGLDQNPGWVRSLGRIVSFHFEDVPGSRP